MIVRVRVRVRVKVRVRKLLLIDEVRVWVS